jgi:hypothetical protein
MIEIVNHPTDDVSRSWHLLFDRIVTAHLEIYALLVAIVALVGIGIIH